MFQDIGARVLGGDDVGGREELRVSTAVVLVIMRAQHVFHRLRGHALDLFHDGVVVPLEFVIDQNYAFVGDQHRDISAIAFDLVEIVVNFVDFQFRRRWGLVLGVRDPGDRQEQCRGG